MKTRLEIQKFKETENETMLLNYIYSKLNDEKKEEFLRGLIGCGLIGGGLIGGGLLVGLISGGIFGGLIGGLIGGGLLVGLISGGLIGGLIGGGLIGGLIGGGLLGGIFGVGIILIISEFLFFLDKRQPEKGKSIFWHTFQLKAEAIFESSASFATINLIYTGLKSLDLSVWTPRIMAFLYYVEIALFAIAALYVFVLLNSLRYSDSKKKEEKGKRK